MNLNQTGTPNFFLSILKLSKHIIVFWAFLSQYKRKKFKFIVSKFSMDNLVKFLLN